MNGIMEWLFLKKNKNNQLKNMEICNHLFKIINQWMTINKDISFNKPYEDIIIEFYIFIYRLDSKTIIDYDSNYCDIFSTKYHSDIVDIFIEFKDICNNYTVDFFNKSNITADILMDFLNYHIDVSDTIHTEEMETLHIEDYLYTTEYE